MSRFVSLAALILVPTISGCASYFTPRPPIVEDRVGVWGSEKVATLATAPDYRVVYVRLAEDAKLCAEAPADAAAQFGSTFAAALTSPTGGPTPLTAEARLGLAVAMKQLFTRSQGIQFFRDGVFALCNMYLNGVIDGAEYREEVSKLREAATMLIKQEIPELNKIKVDNSAAPTVPAPPELKKNP